ncbi:MAG TPA: family 20 glycosylhydrolase [Cytophagaceae bacterium]|jgi:hexosaminidase|nr:family 20 glycosylhydrolase [Cytophagaceae bacterium]
MKSLRILALLLVFALTSCSHQRPNGKDISITWGLVGNYYEGELFLSQLQLKNNGTSALENKNWSLYFNFCRKYNQEKLPKEITIEHVNGDLFVLKPTTEFKTLQPGDSVKFDLYGGYWTLNESDAPAGFFFVFDNGKGENTIEEAGTLTVLPFITEKQLNRTATDKVVCENERVRFTRDSTLTLLPLADVCPITPTPLSYKLGKDSLVIDGKISIATHKDFQATAEFLQMEWGKLLTTKPSIVSLENPSSKQVSLVNDKSLQGEAYELIVNTKGIIIKAGTNEGAFYGVQSLLALNPADAKTSWKITAIIVKDKPRFAFRGLSVDAGRNFQKKETILKVLDAMATYKLNKFQFHLTDDEGWRLEIKELPELTQVGSRRGFSRDEKDMLLPSFGSGPFPDKTSGSGFYTRADFIEILKFAKERNIEVIPEVDFPGHSRAAIKSMQARYNRLKAEGKMEEASYYLLNDFNDSSKYESVQMWTDNVICPCQESSYNFIKTVLGSIEDLYKEAGVKLTTIHTGGDEVPSGVWEKSPKCAELIAKQPELAKLGGLSNYFLTRISDIISEKGLITAGWEEIALAKEKVGDVIHHYPNPAFVHKNFRPNVWNNVWGWGQEDFAYQLANAGYKTVLSNVTNLYFDLAYSKDPKEPGYYWGGFTSTKKAYEFIPLNIYQNASVDLLGNPLDLKNLATKVRLTPQGKENILGIQGQLWTENTKSSTMAEYLLFPRVLALSERAWAQDPAWAQISDATLRSRSLHAAWNEFANRLGQRELPRLDYLDNGIGYRLPPPGLIVQNETAYMNAEFPGLVIRYTIDGTEPTTSSPMYTAPVAVKKGTVVKTITTSATGRVSRISTATVQ